MQNRLQIKNEIELLEALKVVTSSFEEISVLKMNKIRKYVLTTRQFTEGLSEVFNKVKAAYKAYLAEPHTQELALKHNGIVKKNGKKVVVLYSANSKLYGDLNQKVYDLFLKAAQLLDNDVVITGKVGKSYYDDNPSKKEYKYFEIPEKEITVSDLKDLIYYLLPYEKVEVFFGRYESLLAQNAVYSTISGENPSLPQGYSFDRFSFLFEPSLEELVGFFEAQIFSSLLKQSVFEFNLAGVSSRIRAMEIAIDKIDRQVADSQLSYSRAKRQYFDKKQMESVVSVFHR